MRLSHNVPGIKICEVPQLKVGEEATVVISVTNPLDQPITLTFGKPTSGLSLVAGTEDNTETEVIQTRKRRFDTVVLMCMVCRG